MQLFSRQLKLLLAATLFATACVACSRLPAQDETQRLDSTKPRPSSGAPRVQRKQAPQRIATIHWQRVPLRDALGRLHALFDEIVFVDRRVDPSLRVSLDIEAASAEEVVAAIAAERGLGVARLGALVYLGPSGAAEQLRAISAARSQEAARLPADLRASLGRKQRINWPRLSEPRGLAASIVEQRGWRLANAEKIPHDLWAAGELPELTLADKLTVLLIGFDLTFTFRPNDRSIEVVPLTGTMKLPGAGTASKRPVTPANASRTKPGARHVYTLRVQEEPVRAVLQELQVRLHWPIQIDEESIRAAGKSLDKRVSFSVENADQEHLLEALLHPAGLDYHLEEDRVRIIARRYSE